MIGTNESGTRILFSQGIYRHKYNSPYVADMRPDTYTGEEGVYVELRSHDWDYILEKVTIVGGVRTATWEVLNVGYDTEAERVRFAISVLDRMAEEHEKLFETEKRA